MSLRSIAELSTLHALEGPWTPSIISHEDVASQQTDRPGDLDSRV